MTLIVFDCDGTIVDSQAGIVLSMDHAFRSLHMTPPPRDRTLSVVGLSLPEAFSVLAPEAEYETRAELAERYKCAFRELNHDPDESDILYGDAKATIESLARKPDILLGLATGKSRRGVDRLFEREGWHPIFATIQTADDHPSKPHPAMLIEAMRETGAVPLDTVMVGDTTYDVAMARAVGCGAIGVTWGYHDVEELIEAGAHQIIEDYSELPAAVESVLARLRQAA